MTEYRNIMKDFFGNPNVGLFCFATNTYGLVSSTLMEADIKELSDVLNIDLVETTISGTSLVGVFCAGNDKLLFLPNVINPTEIAHIKKELKSKDVEVIILDTMYTALNNNMVCIDDVCFVNPDLEDTVIKTLEEYFSKVIKITIASLNNIGAMMSHNSKGLVINNHIKDDELNVILNNSKFDEKTMVLSTINNGNTFISSGIIVNDFGLVVGDSSTGVEITELYQIFR